MSATVNSIKFSHKMGADTRVPQLKLKLLDIGSGGFVIDSRHHIDVYANTITSSFGVINFYGTVSSGHAFDLRGAIVDSAGRSVGVNIASAPGQHVAIEFTGAGNNTYSGPTNVMGRNHLVLYKDNGLLAISGDLNIQDGGEVSVRGNEQIANSSRVSLSSRFGPAAKLVFNGNYGKARSIEETIGDLVVAGAGIVDFHFNEKVEAMGSRHFFMDDLIIAEGSKLLVQHWADSRDFFLVKKGAAHLEDSLKRIEFEGYSPNNVHLADFNKDYWQVSALPEPLTYGAGLLGLSLGTLYLRRSKRRSAAPASGGHA